MKTKFLISSILLPVVLLFTLGAALPIDIKLARQTNMGTVYCKKCGKDVLIPHFCPSKN